MESNVRPGGEPSAERATLPRWARAVLVAALVAGTYLRVAGVSGQALAGDEPIAMGPITEGYGAVLTTFDGRGSHIGFTLAQRVSCDLFGRNMLGYRLPAVVAGLLALYLLYPLGRRIVGPGPAWLATVTLAVSSLHVYHSRSARPYALAFLLVLLLVAAACAALRGNARAWVGLALLSGVLPWVHLTSLVPLALVWLTCLLWTWRARAPLRPRLLALAGGALLSIGLYLPAWEGILDYVGGLGRSRGFRPGSTVRTLEVLGGTLSGGIWALFGGLLGALLLFRRARREALVLGAVIVAAPLAIMVARPAGGHLALSRYLMIGFAPMLLASSYAVFDLLRLARAREGVICAVGLALVLLQAWRGPLDRSWVRGTFTNAPEIVLAQPGIDGPLAEVPELYRQLAASPRELTIVEFPTHPRARLLLRKYELVHGQRVLVGLESHKDMELDCPPYVSLKDLSALAQQADWLIVHLDIRAEIRANLGVEDDGTERPSFIRVEERLPRLMAALGEPAFRDERLVAWRLRGF